MTKTLEQAGTYTYTITQDGPELKKGDEIVIRRMGKQERNAFLRKQFRLLDSMVNEVANRLTDGMCSPEEVERLHKAAKRLGKALCLPDGMAMVRNLDDWANIADMIGFVVRVCVVELTLESGQDVPEQVILVTPDEVDDLPDDAVEKQLGEAERLGEPGPPSESQAITTLTGSPVETSSSSPEDISMANESAAPATSQ